MTMASWTQTRSVYLSALRLAPALMSALAVFVSSCDTSAGEGRKQQIEPLSSHQWAMLVGGGDVMTTAVSAETTVVFTDYQCPVCRSHFLELDRRIAAGEVVGTIRIYHFPLRHHTRAYVMALGAVCAAQRGALLSYSRIAFTATSGLSPEDVVAALVRTSGMGAEAGQRCLAAPGSAARIQRDIAAGSLLRIRGTPTIVTREGMSDGFVPSR